MSGGPPSPYCLITVIFSQLCLVIEVSLAQTVLDGQNLIFLEGEGELSMPICFRIYVFSL